MAKLLALNRFSQTFSLICATTVNLVGIWKLWLDHRYTCMSLLKWWYLFLNLQPTIPLIDGIFEFLTFLINDSNCDLARLTIIDWIGLLSWEIFIWYYTSQLWSTNIRPQRLLFRLFLLLSNAISKHDHHFCCLIHVSSLILHFSNAFFGWNFEVIKCVN